MSRMNRGRLIETRDLRAPLIAGERVLWFEEAEEAGLETPLVEFLFNRTAYKWLLEHECITREGFRTKQLADESH